MPTYQTSEYEDHTDLLEVMSNSISAIRAFNTLLELALRAGDDVRNDTWGIYMLLDRQQEDLSDAVDALRKEFSEMQAGKLKIKNPEKIAEWAGVSQYDVNRVISIATGIDLGPPTARHKKEPPYVLEKEVSDA